MLESAEPPPTQIAPPQVDGLGTSDRGRLLVLTPSQASRRQAEGRDTGAPLSLLIAFISLILTTLLYSLLAGENMEGARARSATVELIDGLVFGLAIVTLLQGVTLLMRDANIEPAAVRVARFATVVAFPSSRSTSSPRAHRTQR